MSKNSEGTSIYPNDADGDALRRVAARSDMSRPMSIDFMVAVPDESAGRAVAEGARVAGFETTLECDEDSRSWTCYCTRTMLATYEGIIAAQSELDLLARSVGGYADGWGTSGNGQNS